MSLDALVHVVIRRIKRATTSDTESTPYEANASKLTTRLWDVFLRTYDLGFIAFGGPPVHFQILHKRFVEGIGKIPWVDEQTYQELFALAQATPGPGSTKMLFNIVQMHAGLIPALFVFLVWSLPAAIAMYGLSLGVQRIGETLPDPVYTLLSGMNAAIVGLIALSAVQLAKKAITDPLTRVLVTVGGCAGMCYNALWYFPVLLAMGGLSTLVWDFLPGRSWVRWLKEKRRPRRRSFDPPVLEVGEVEMDNIPMKSIDISVQEERRSSEHSGPQRRQITSVTAQESQISNNIIAEDSTPVVQSPSRTEALAHTISIKTGLISILLFFALFIVFMTLRGVLHPAPLLLALFNNMLLAGTIIFGGGPVVIPLLRDYVVDPGWVSPRDFLLGLAVIQAMPGPNFNFAVYLGALAVAGPAGASKPVPSVVGAILGFIGIFTPGIWISVGFQSIFQSLRKRRAVSSILRGVNATAVGFVFTAVYRLWEIGYLTQTSAQGMSLGEEPWWLVVAASTYVGVEWFGVPPFVAILVGGGAGVGWWGAVGRRVNH
ncbi:chromate transporter-domain-containing protein [Gymnopilus junonius]|uniref:Chromate transporter-domain-containing protein n=1 Tax=Gymnopilus junonius TaxID=109634 RepID=A0A9P5NV50_GYMJU|nr:chromate transporter-domain-containing protein [Gymnopilus junonius]